MTTSNPGPDDPCEGQHTLEPEGYEGATRRSPAQRVRVVCAGCGGRATVDVEEDLERVRTLRY